MKIGPLIDTLELVNPIRNLYLLQLYGYFRCGEDAMAVIHRKLLVPDNESGIDIAFAYHLDMAFDIRIIALGGPSQYDGVYRTFAELYHGRKLRTGWTPADYHHKTFFLVRSA